MNKCATIATLACPTPKGGREKRKEKRLALLHIKTLLMLEFKTLWHRHNNKQEYRKSRNKIKKFIETWYIKEVEL